MPFALLVRKSVFEIVPSNRSRFRPLSGVDCPIYGKLSVYGGCSVEHDRNALVQSE